MTSFIFITSAVSFIAYSVSFITTATINITTAERKRNKTGKYLLKDKKQIKGHR